mgnify:CR=1 FL=1
MASSFQMEFVRKNFLFLMTGFGKGIFNIFVGSMLFINQHSTGGAIMGFAMIAAGCIFIFLSKYKQMSDEDLVRAVSVTRKSVNNAVIGVARDNQGVIRQAAYDNKDVIAQVAYDNKDVVAQAAYDNRELLAETYLKNQG